MKKMKKVTILFLIAFLMLFSANVFAYNLWVAGVQVTDANKGNITGTGISGSVSYNLESNTLILDNANISTSSGTVIDNGISNLTINLIGENTITANAIGIESYQADFKITGSGSLTINADFGISHVDCDLTIENTTVTAIGNICGIVGDDGNEVLSITNSTVKATGTNNASIEGMSNLVLNGCAITQPAGAVFDNHAVRLNGEIVTTEIVIEPVIYYNLYVASVQVTDENKDDITVAVVAAGREASGTITYNPVSNTLTLEDANISTLSGTVIDNGISNLTINLIGENTITANPMGIESSQADFKITGSGSLTINADFGIAHVDCDLTIENTTVTANGSFYGIRGYDGNNEVLSITNSTVKATGTNTASIGNINSLILNGCAIIEPTGATFNASQKAVCVNGTKVKTEIVIEPVIYYDLWVADVQVSDANKDDITGTGISGSVNYNSESNTLTLDGASISATVDGIKNTIPNLTINLIGENSITASDYGIYSYEADFTIIGNGSLIINAYFAIYHNYCNLTIENTTVTAIGGGYGICGYYGNNEVLSITNSTVRATGTNGGSIAKIKNLVLNGCAILQPAGAVFNAGQKEVIDANGDIVTTEVVIEPIAPATYTVSGMVAENGVGLAGVTISYTGGSTTTAANGTYSFTSQANTTHTVTPSKAGYTFTPASLTVNVAEANVTGQDFVGTAVATYTVSGTVKAIADDSPIAGVTITYNGGGMNGTTTTAADGTYSFVANENTTYTVIANKTGFSFLPATKTVNVAEANVTDVDFYGTVTYIVEGIVRDAQNDDPIAGVTISYTGGSTTTASDGMFSFTATANTSYIVTPSKAGYIFTPATKTVNVAGADVTGVIFFGISDGTPVDETEINAITVYPNPANDYIKVAGLTGNEEILVFDINGRIVKTLEANNNIETISINDLAKGSYMIKVRKENKIEILKFIK